MGWEIYPDGLYELSSACTPSTSRRRCTSPRTAPRSRTSARTAASRIRPARRTSSATSERSPARSTPASRCRATSSGRCSTTSSGPSATRSASASSTSTTRRSNAFRRPATAGTGTSSPPSALRPLTPRGHAVAPANTAGMGMSEAEARGRRREAAPVAVPRSARHRRARARQLEPELGAPRSSVVGLAARRASHAAAHGGPRPQHAGESASCARSAALVLLGLLVLGNFVALAILVAALVTTNTEDLGGGELLLTAFAIYTTDVIVFGLLFWELDAGGPAVRLRMRERKPFDFLFPQDESLRARRRALASPGLGLPLRLADELDRVQPDRHDAADRAREARHGARVGDLRGDDPPRRSAGGERARLVSCVCVR